MGTLPDRAVIRVTGDDAEKLLNDTLTGRFHGPMGLEGRWFALLSPQGKIQIEGLATQADGATWLDIPRTEAATFLKRMKLYRLRAKAEFEDVSEEYAVSWSQDSGAIPHTSWLIFYGDNRARLGVRALVPRVEVDPADNATTSYHAARIAEGVAELGPDFAADQMFPHDIGMDLLGGVDFKKGCYVGQEVVSRMEHRGTARRRPVIVSGVDAPAGTAVVVGGRDAGAIGTPVGGKAVAIVRLDRFDGGQVTVGGEPVEITLPAWATYRLGESAAAE
jgi:tRNA-modifying protein YgfZ